ETADETEEQKRCDAARRLNDLRRGGNLRRTNSPRAAIVTVGKFGKDNQTRHREQILVGRLDWNSESDFVRLARFYTRVADDRFAALRERKEIDVLIVRDLFARDF